MRAIIGLVCLMVVCLMMGCSTPVEDLSGQWSGWGGITITKTAEGDYKGTYQDTYGTGPGTFELHKEGPETFLGKWGESKKRFGTLKAVKTDEETLEVHWVSDLACTINPGTGGDDTWHKVASSNAGK